MSTVNTNERQSLYAEVTSRIIAELEVGRLPWVQPWDASRCPCTLPHNVGSGRTYSGINILILWTSAIEQGFSSQRWLTYRQAEAAGGHVRRGEKGTVVCYADRFTPREEAAKARDEDREARTVAFLKRFTVFNLDQCEDLPEDMVQPVAPIAPELAIAGADRVIQNSGVTFRIGGGEAFYSPTHDVVQVPPQAAFLEPINWFRTALHELGHATGHKSRLDRDQTGEFGSAAYAKEELIAEMASAFACAALGIVSTVRHADYIGAWLEVLCADQKAIFRAASAASKAADFLLAWGGSVMSPPLPPEWGTPVLPTLSPRTFWRRGQRGLRRMTKRQRAIFAAVRFEGASYAALAQRHGISVAAVQAELAKALSILTRAVYGHW